MLSIHALDSGRGYLVIYISDSHLNLKPTAAAAPSEVSGASLVEFRLLLTHLSTVHDLCLLSPPQPTQHQH